MLTMGHAIRKDLTSPAALILGAAVVIGGTFGGLLLASTSAASGRQVVATGTTIDVTGTGVARGTPDTLTMQIAVSTTEPTAAAALETNNTKMTTLQSVFRRSGVAPEDLQTTGLNLSPNYDSSGNVTGFTAEDDLTVAMHGLAGQERSSMLARTRSATPPRSRASRFRSPTPLHWPRSREPRRWRTRGTRLRISRRLVGIHLVRS